MIILFAEVISPSRIATEFNGNAVELEIYSKSVDPEAGANYKLEICYVPDSGCLPRYMRRILTRNDAISTVQERHITKVSRTSKGAFLPTQILEFQINVKNLWKRFPNYSPMMALQFPIEVQFSLFELSDIREGAGAVSIAKEGNSILTTPGGLVALKGASKTVNMNTISSGAGPKLYTSSRGLPTLDQGEIDRFKDKTSNSFWFYLTSSVVVTLFVVTLCLWLVRRRLLRSSMFLLPILPLLNAGCEPRKPPLGLNVILDKTSAVYERNGDGGPTLLTIENTGLENLVIHKVDGGCTCRQIDQKFLPAKLPSGKSIELPIKFTFDGSSYERKIYQIIVSTDKGEFHEKVALTALPRHRIDPGYISSSNIEEDDNWLFKITHRQIVEKGRRDSERQWALRSPLEFSCKTTDVRTGTVAILPSCNYIDTDYEISLVDRKLGTFKRFISLVHNDSAVALDLPIVWCRFPFLSCLPERALLSTKPSRVFLRCPKDDVELMKIRSVPAGVTALISSPREIILSLAKPMVEQIEGFVKVETNDPVHPVLSIPVLSSLQNSR